MQEQSEFWHLSREEDRLELSTKKKVGVLVLAWEELCSLIRKPENLGEVKENPVKS